jgi:hypothetical protein
MLRKRGFGFLRHTTSFLNRYACMVRHGVSTRIPQ